MDEKILKFSLGCLLVLTLSCAESSSKLSIHENPYQYADEYTDSESHLQYLNARYYNPAIGHFIQWDSYSEDQKENIFDGRYNYGADNPIMDTDPSGHSELRGTIPPLSSFKSSAAANILEDVEATNIEAEALQGAANMFARAEAAALSRRDTEAELAATRTELATLQAEHARAMNSLQELQGKYSALLYKGGELYKQCQELSAYNANQKLIIADLTTSNETLQEENQNLWDDHQESHTAKTRAEHETTRLTIENNSLREANNKITTAYEQLSKRNADLTEYTNRIVNTFNERAKPPNQSTAIEVKKAKALKKQ